MKAQSPEKSMNVRSVKVSERMVCSLAARELVHGETGAIPPSAKCEGACSIRTKCAQNLYTTKVTLFFLARTSNGTGRGCFSNRPCSSIVLRVPRNWKMTSMGSPRKLECGVPPGVLFTCEEFAESSANRGWAMVPVPSRTPSKSRPETRPQRTRARPRTRAGPW